MSRIQISTPSLGREELEAIRGPLESGWLTQGRNVKEFENEFARRHRVKHALATTSCTTALHLMLAAAGIGPDDEVIVPSFTWISTANAVLYCGATPVLVDIDIDTFNISLEETVKKITKKTKAVIVVHLFGLCVDVSKFREVLGNDIMIFEDAACASGAEINGQSAGSMGDAAAFSFHPRKSITTGEGGMLTTNNKELSVRAEKLRNHGAEMSEEERHQGPAPYLLPEFNLLGFNYRMTDIQGAIGKEQLKKLDSFVEERKLQASRYKRELSHLQNIALPIEPLNGVHAWQAYVLRVNNDGDESYRNNIMKKLDSVGISSRPGTHAIHLLKFYCDKFKFKPQDFPNSLVASQTSLAIPMHNKLTPLDQERVISHLQEFLD